MPLFFYVRVYTTAPKRSIADLTRLPSALFVIDVAKENIAVREANRLGIPVFGIVDTNSNPSGIDFVIPANDDATKSIEVILDACCAAIAEGLEERKIEKLDVNEPAEEEEGEEKAERRERPRRERTRRARIEKPATEAPAEEVPADEAPAAE